MGQKVNPIGFRLGINKDWQSKWYAEKNDYVTKLNKDLKIRDFLAKNLKDAGIASVLIERKKNRCDITIETAKAKTRIYLIIVLNTFIIYLLLLF